MYSLNLRPKCGIRATVAQFDRPPLHLTNQEAANLHSWISFVLVLLVLRRSSFLGNCDLFLHLFEFLKFSVFLTINLANLVTSSDIFTALRRQELVKNAKSGLVVQVQFARTFKFIAPGLEKRPLSPLHLRKQFQSLFETISVLFATRPADVSR